MEHALEDPFLTFVDDLPGSVTEVLIATLVTWDREGKQFKAGVWPEQKPILKLYDDLSTWRLELKKTAIGLAPLAYLLIPSVSVPAQEHAMWVQNATLQLLAESKFLWFGLDALGKTRNFTHPGLRDAAIGFFYTGPYQIAQKRPDIFRKQLPISCLALVSAMYNCVLDGLAKNGHSKFYPKFSTKEYGPIYRQMLKMINEILRHASWSQVVLVLWVLCIWYLLGGLCQPSCDGTSLAHHIHLERKSYEHEFEKKRKEILQSPQELPKGWVPLDAWRCSSRDICMLHYETFRTFYVYMPQMKVAGDLHTYIVFQLSLEDWYICVDRSKALDHVWEILLEGIT
ncbi:hypothetical protein EDB19DRAFT_1829483 [Suillus lakei]|nr:hypothetical protein EDB19DRAFT_1829483 [Suillus lakei]